MDDALDDPVIDIRNKLNTLYQRILENSTAPIDAVSEAYQALSMLVEELQQADLQIRLNYEELLNTRQSLEEERARFQELFEFAPDAYLVTDIYGSIKNANQAAAEMLNVRKDFLIGKPFSVFIKKLDWNRVADQIQQEKQPHYFELDVRPRGKEAITVSAKIGLVMSTEREPVAYRLLLRDITEQKHAQQALTASEARFRAIFEGANIGVILTDTQHRIEAANPALNTMLGYPDGALLNRSIADLMVESGNRLHEEISTALLHNLSRQYHGEHRFRSQAGGELWLRLSVSAIDNSELQSQYLLYLAENITETRRAALELEESKRRLLASGEVEKLHLAQELHDGPMQDLYSAVFRLSLPETKLQDNEIRDTIKESQEMLRKVAGTLREICGDLRPTALESFGLEKAIRSHAENIQERHPELRVHLDLQMDERALLKEVRLGLFRIYQHAITNIVRHAQASQVLVLLRLTDESVLLSIQDNGQGFAVPANWLELLREGHYGLAGMAERAEMLGGKLTIESGPGTGTRVEIIVPR